MRVLSDRLLTDPTAEIEKILITALIGAVFAYFHQLWKYSRDAYEARIDEACDLIFNLAETAAEYWISPKLNPRHELGPIRHSASVSRQLVPPSLELLQVRIEGGVKKLEFLRLMLQPRLSLHDRQLLVDRMASFLDSMTGGQFASKARAADESRAREVYVTASDLVAHLRTASQRANGWWLTLFRQFEIVRPYRPPHSHRESIADTLILSITVPALLIGLLLVLVSLIF